MRGMEDQNTKFKEELDRLMPCHAVFRTYSTPLSDLSRISVIQIRPWHDRLKMTGFRRVNLHIYGS
jgi:hypothetical protein